MSDLEEMCRELEAVCTLAKGFAVHLDGFATRVERTQRDTWQVAGPLLSDQLTRAMQACGQHRQPRRTLPRKAPTTSTTFVAEIED